MNEIVNLYERAVLLEKEWQDKNPQRGPFPIMTVEIREMMIASLLASFKEFKSSSVKKLDD